MKNIRTGESLYQGPAVKAQGVEWRVLLACSHQVYLQLS